MGKDKFLRPWDSRTVCCCRMTSAALTDTSRVENIWGPQGQGTTAEHGVSGHSQRWWPPGAVVERVALDKVRLIPHCTSPTCASGSRPTSASNSWKVTAPIMGSLRRLQGMPQIHRTREALRESELRLVCLRIYYFKTRV